MKKQLLVSTALAGVLAGGIYYGGQAIASDAGPELVVADEKPMANHVLEGPPVSPDEIQSDGEAVRTGAGTIERARRGEWLWAVGGMLMLLVYAVRRLVVKRVTWFKTRTGGAVLAFGISMVTFIAVQLQATDASFSWALVGQALTVALTAAGYWGTRPKPPA